MATHGLQANTQGGNPLLAELAAARRAREAERGSHEGSAAARQAAPAARAAPAKEQEAQRTLNAISLLSYNIWYATAPSCSTNALPSPAQEPPSIIERMLRPFVLAGLLCEVTGWQMLASSAVHGAQV